MTATRLPMLVAMSPSGLFHRVHKHGVSTFCGLDLSDPRRRDWPVAEADLPPTDMCQRCMPEGGPRG